MRQKIVTAILYAVTSISLWAFLDAIYGAGSITRYNILVYSATLGLGLFIVACLLAPFQRHWSIRCAVAGAVLSWPEFILVLSAVPWGNLIWFIRYRPGTATALVSLAFSSIYSLSQMLSLNRLSSQGGGLA
jgi:hypothetical protein